MSKKIKIFALLFAVVLVNCGGSGSSKRVTVSWDANNDKSVNATGGGYTLYYSQQSGFDINSADKTDVPYVSGATAPNSVTLSLEEGMWFIRIAAYGLVSGTLNSSDVSEQLAVNVGG